MRLDVRKANKSSGKKKVLQSLRKLAYAALIVSMLSCGKPPGEMSSAKYLSLNIDDNFRSSEAYGVFESVASDMNKRSGEDVLYRDAKEDGVRSVTLRYGKLSDPTHLAETECDDTGRSCMITLNTGARGVMLEEDSDSLSLEYHRRRLHTIIRHELGHAFGLGHLTDSSDIMYSLAVGTNMPKSVDGTDSSYDVILKQFHSELKAVRDGG